MEQKQQQIHDDSRKQFDFLEAITTSVRTCFILPALLLLASLLIATAAPDARAQTNQTPQLPIIQQGDAVVTGFSGIMALKPSPNKKIEDYVIIDTQAASLQVFDLSRMFGPDDARLVKAPRQYSVPALQIGQVFGVALDDGQPASGRPVNKNPVANIYATATSAYGLQIVETKLVGNQKTLERAKTGSPQASWMGGQFGPGGGPGSIWKIDGRTGEVRLFANVTLNGAPNSGPALGAITFDPRTRRLFVSDLQTGMIHAFDLTGREVAIFDHGTQGRSRQGLPAVAYNPATRVEVTNPAFNAQNPASWGYANISRRVWGLGVNGGRLYYSASEGPDIWSVGLTAAGGFANDSRLEVEVLSRAGDAISAITFGNDGTMYLSQRGKSAPPYDFQVMATPGTAEVLRYQRRTLPSGRKAWEPAPKEYAVGHSQAHRNGNGGVALGYGYDENGYIRYDRCKGTVWSTGEILRQGAAPDFRLSIGGPLIVHGLQGNSVRLVKPSNVAPFRAYFIDFDSNHSDPGFRGHMGDVAIWSPCAGKPAPKPFKGPRIRIAKSCSAAAFGIDLHCRVTLTSTGTVAPKGPVGFTDIGTTLKGPSWAGKNPLIFSAEWDDPNMTCSDLPDTTFKCSIPGAVMQPGQSRFVDIIVDLAEVVDTPDWRIRNCATLDGTKQSSCVTRGEEDSLIVSKFGPNQQPCIAGGPCDFEVEVFNPGKRTFDGELLFADNLTIGGAGVGGITVDAVFPQNGCDIIGLTLPLQWQCHVTIPPGGARVFNILTTIPAGAVPAGATQGRNCFLATNPQLALTPGNQLHPNVWDRLLGLGSAGTAGGLGSDCIEFDVLPAGVISIRKPGLPLGKLLVGVTPKPSFFTSAGQTINYSYVIRNTGVEPVTSFTLTDNKATGIKCNPLKGGSLAPGATTLCSGSYVTKAGDVGKDIASKADITGKTATGPVPKAPSAHAKVVFFGPAAMSLAVQPSPSTFSAAGEKIVYRYTLRNTGGTPITTATVTDSKVTNITCRPAAGGPIAVGASIACTGTYTATVGDVGKDIASTASVTGKTASGTVKSPQPVKSVVKFVKPPVAGKPNLTLNVTAVPTTYSAANQAIKYAFTIRNAGPGAAPFFVFSNDRATVTCPKLAVPAICSTKGLPDTCGALAAGASISCTGTYTSTASDVGADINSGTTVFGLPEVPANATELTKKIQSAAASGNILRATTVVKFKSAGTPKLTVEMTASPKTFSKAGEKITYTYKVTNTGKGHITGSLGLYNLKGARVSDQCSPWPNRLAPGKSASCTRTYMTTTADVGKDITAGVSASGFAAGNTTGKQERSNTVKVVIKYVKPKPVAKPSISLLVKPAQSTYKNAGERITYTYTVRNTGNVAVNAFTLTDDTATGLKCAPGNTSANGGPLASKASAICTGSYTTTASDVGRNVESSASVTGAAGSAPVKTPAVKSVVSWNGKSDVTLTASASPGTFSRAGQQIATTYKVTNTGDVTLVKFSISHNGYGKTANLDNKKCPPANADHNGGRIAPGASVTCTGLYTTKPSDVGKDITFEVFIRGYINPKFLPEGNLKPVKVVVKYVKPKVVPKPSLSLAVKPSPGTFSAAGQTITYIYTVANTGNVPFKTFGLEDKLPGLAGLECPPGKSAQGGALAPGASATCLSKYTTRPGDLGRDIESRPTAFAKPAKGRVVDSPSASAVVKFAGKPAMSLTHTCNPKVYTAAGQAINCSFTVTNSGTIPIRSCQITGSRINVSCPAGVIPPGASILVQGAYSTNAGDIGKNIVMDFKLDGITQ